MRDYFSVLICENSVLICARLILCVCYIFSECCVQFIVRDSRDYFCVTRQLKKNGVWKSSRASVWHYWQRVLAFCENSACKYQSRVCRLFCSFPEMFVQWPFKEMWSVRQKCTWILKFSVTRYELFSECKYFL